MGRLRSDAVRGGAGPLSNARWFVGNGQLWCCDERGPAPPPAASGLVLMPRVWWWCGVVWCGVVWCGGVWLLWNLAWNL